MTEMTEYGRPARAERPLAQAMWRGFQCRCPNCGEGHLFRSFLKTVDNCERCGEEMRCSSRAHLDEWV